MNERRREPKGRIELFCTCCQKEKCAEFDPDSGQIIIKRIRRNDVHFCVLDIDKLKEQMENKNVISNNL